MANRAYLINTSTLSSDRAELEASLVSAGHEYVEVAESANRIPIPWLCCFRERDLQSVSVELGDFDGIKSQFQFFAPRTSVASAAENLRASLPLFEEIAGSRIIAQEYWQAALGGIETLPLPYLTLDPLDVLLLNDPAEDALAFAKCFSGNSASIPFLKRLAFFEENHEPYSLNDYCSKSADELNHVARRGNAEALNAMYFYPEFRFWHRRE